LIAGFDQEAAAIVMARQVSYKMETEVSAWCFFSLLLFLDKCINLPVCVIGIRLLLNSRTLTLLHNFL